MVLWTKYDQKMVENALEKYKDYPIVLKERLKIINAAMKGMKFNVHVLFNNSAIVIGLLYGDGDFSQTCRIATECGDDTDCNAGNAAAILGAYLGQNLIPAYFKRFIRGEIEPAIKKWKDKSIYNLSNRTFTQALRFDKVLQSQ